MDIYTEIAKATGKPRGQVKAETFAWVYSEENSSACISSMARAIKAHERKGISMRYDYIFSLKCNLGTFLSVRLMADNYHAAHDELWRVFRALPGMAERQGHDAGYTVRAWAWRPHSDAPLPKQIRVDTYTSRITDDPADPTIEGD